MDMEQAVQQLVKAAMKQQDNLIAAYLQQNPNLRVEDVVLMQEHTETGIKFTVTNKYAMLKGA